MLKDGALTGFFGWDEIAHLFGRRLAEMRWSHNLGLQRIVTGLSDRVLRVGQRLVAIDSTVVSVFGRRSKGLSAATTLINLDGTPTILSWWMWARARWWTVICVRALRQQPWA